METITSVIKHLLPGSYLSELKMRKTKYEYISVHGIGEFQKEELARNINNSVSICIFIDTATFKQKSEITGSLVKNLDIMVRFFNEGTDRVETHFLDVVFISKETADVQIDKIMKVLGDLDISISKVTQLSRDHVLFTQLIQDSRNVSWS